MRVIGLAGWSGAGKTTLLVQIIPVLFTRGVSVSTIKHAHHAFDVDKPGKDSYEHRAAGAGEVLVASSRRWALIHELRGTPEPPLAEHLMRLSPVDLVIVEGFKRDAHAKIEVWRAANGKPYLHPDDPTIVAVVGDMPSEQATLPHIALDDIESAAASVLRYALPLDETLRRLAVGRMAERDGAAQQG